MITRDTQVVGQSQPDMSLDTFSKVLVEGSTLSAEDITNGYQAVIKWKVSPAFALACFWVESKFGKIGICAEFTTRSPGNTRTSFLGKGRVIPTPKGGYVQYDTWADGFEDMAARLVGKPDYKGLSTIAQILPVFAPVEDGNDPTAYANSVVDMINGWISQGGNSSTMALNITDLSNNTPASVYTDRGLPISELVLHDTSGSGDFNSKSPAELQALLNATIHWFQGSGGVSIHYLIGPEALGGKIYRLCKEQYAAYHVVGDKGPYTFNGVTCSKDNRIAIGIERFGQPNEAVGPNQRAAMLALVVDICQRNGLTASQVISHMSIQADRKDGGVLLSAARQAVNNGGLSYVTTENKTPLPTGLINNHTLGGGFKTFYQKLAGVSPNFELLVLGLPVTDEFDADVNGDGKNFTVQLYERGALLYEAANASPWDCHLTTTDQLERVLAAARAKGLV